MSISRAEPPGLMLKTMAAADRATAQPEILQRGHPNPSAAA
jgi:hypothetical protein